MSHPDEKVREACPAYLTEGTSAEMRKKVDSMRPLFEPHDEPTRHRGRADVDGESIVKPLRRPSPIAVVNRLRAAMKDWRNSSYAGVSETTFELLVHWFHNEHRMTTPDGEIAFNYYWCQREAVETFIYLKEVRRVNSLTDLIGEFGPGDDEARLIAGLSVEPSENRWPRYAMKLATGAGKTKLMSLLIAYSYFHRVREVDSPMAKDFVIIAPGLTVYERLKEDFGDGRVFNSDPVIPPAWRNQWNLDIVLQEEAGGGSTGGTLYLTNVHRLYEKRSRTRKKDETHDWAGPAVSKQSALDTSAELRDRITEHRDLMVLNDEAHHVWDPDSAWNEAIEALHVGSRDNAGRGVIAQIDLSATPRDNKGQNFRHIVCDTPLGEAVDAGIVKAPIIGVGKLRIEPSDDASQKYDRHLRLGYERWLSSHREWQRAGKKALLFVMCEDTEAADQITRRLNTDETFKELNDRVVNLHTNLKGEVKAVGRGKNKVMKFVENDKQISDDDLKELRRLSRELDSGDSPYRCIVSVLMLREGWDTRNVTTIVPLRALTTPNEVLPEQTLGRGLRRMTPPGMGSALETVTVIEHEQFQRMYRDKLEQEGLITDPVDPGENSSTTVSIFPDHENKDVEALDITMPQLAAGHQTSRSVGDVTDAEMDKAASRYDPIPLGNATKLQINYEGRHLVTNEVVEASKIELPLLKNPVGAISYFVRRIERICKVPNLHKMLAPQITRYLTTILFGEKVELFDPKLSKRLGDPDVAEHIQAVFVPLIREKTTDVQDRTIISPPRQLSQWKPYQVTQNERHPTLLSRQTLFNLVPCDRDLEVAFCQFATSATDVAAIAKNAGPQKLRIDYLSGGSRIAFYVPDFFVRCGDGVHYLVETKGREDRDVPAKARAAVAWCDAATAGGVTWRYLFVPEGVFGRYDGDTIAQLASTCGPSLTDLIDEAEDRSEDFEGRDMPLLRYGRQQKAGEDDAVDVDRVELNPESVAALTAAGRDALNQATLMFGFLADKPNANLSSVLHPLLSPLDAVCRSVIENRLVPRMPSSDRAIDDWFSVDLSSLRGGSKAHYQRVVENLEKTLRYGSGTMPIGLLRDLMELSLNDRKNHFDGVLKEATGSFSFAGGRRLLDELKHVYQFRNEHVAHSEKPLTDVDLVRSELPRWLDVMAALTKVATDN